MQAWGRCVARLGLRAPPHPPPSEGAKVAGPLKCSESRDLLSPPSQGGTGPSVSPTLTTSDATTDPRHLKLIAACAESLCSYGAGGQGETRGPAAPAPGTTPLGPTTPHTQPGAKSIFSPTAVRPLKQACISLISVQSRSSSWGK